MLFFFTENESKLHLPCHPQFAAAGMLFVLYVFDSGNERGIHLNGSTQKNLHLRRSAQETFIRHELQAATAPEM